MLDFVFDLLSIFFVGVAICYVFFLLYDYCKDRKKEQRRKVLNNRKIDYVLSQVYFNNNKIDKVQNHLNSLQNKLDQIIDFINDNECSVKDDE